MNTQTDHVEQEKGKLVRTSVLVEEGTDQALRELAEEARRPLSWEIRLALEAHVEREAHRLEVAA